MKPQRRRKHKWALMLKDAWHLFHSGRFSAVFTAMALHFKAILQFPQFHDDHCEFCHRLGVWFRI